MDWIDRFPELILACDTHYPQFPLVRDDPTFSSDPIVPSEPQLAACIERYKKVPGTSYRDASLFCLSHVYTASVREVYEAMEGRGPLRYYFSNNAAVIDANNYAATSSL
jgi:hypothetical protein